MAAHIETGTMVDPRYESRHLGHLGLVADSALYTAETLRELEGMAWITRIPETLSAAREAIEADVPGLMASPEKLSLQRQEADYARVKQRWVVVYSPEAYQRALKSVNRHCEKQSEADHAKGSRRRSVQARARCIVYYQFPGRLYQRDHAARRILDCRERLGSSSMAKRNARYR